MRIATWNINGLRARLDYIRHWLDAVQPDVVGFQELKTPDDQFPHEAFKELGYKAVIHGQQRWNGVAVLAKQRRKLELLQAGLPGQEHMGARLISAKVSGLTFINVYCPNGKNLLHEDYSRKLDWFASLRQYLADTHKPSEKLVLVGDFNIVPSGIDSWNESVLHGNICHSDRERAQIKSLLDLGLYDLWRETRPDDAGHSWWDYRGGSFYKRQGLRIDLLLGTKPVLAKAKSVSLERRWRKKLEDLKPSDHCPIWADI